MLVLMILIQTLKHPRQPPENQVIAMTTPIHQNQTGVSSACPDNDLKMIS